MEPSLPVLNESLQQQKTLVNAILKLPRMTELAHRLAAIDLLPDPIKAAIPEAADAKAHINYIVSTCDDFPRGLAHLRTALEFFYKEARTFSEVRRLLDLLISDPPAIQRYLNELIDDLQAYIRDRQPVPLAAKDTPEAIQPVQRRPERRFSSIAPGRAATAEGNAPASARPREFGSFEEAFTACGRRILLLGEPGAGKSTTMHEAALKAAEQRLADPSLPIPIVVYLYEFQNTRFSKIEPGTLPALLQNSAASRGASLFQDQPLLYFLDGLDEMGGERPAEPEQPDGAKWDPRAEFLACMQEQIPDDPLVVSCRVADYNQIQEKTLLPGAVTLLPLSDEKIREFVLDKREQPRLWSLLERDPALLELARTPFLLALLSSAVGDGGEAIDLRSAEDLIDLYTDQRYRHEAARRSIPFTLKETRDLLGTLATCMVNNGWRAARSLRISEARSISIKHAAALLDFAVTMRLLILAADGNTIEFPHLAFRDHFATPLLVQALTADTITARWRGSRLFQNIRSRWEIRILRSLPKALGIDYSSVRGSAAYALSSIGPAAIPALIVALDGMDKDVRRIAYSVLDRIGSAAIPVLIAAFAGVNKRAGWSAAYALGRVGGPAAVPALITALADADQYVRVCAAHALGNIGPAASDAIPAIIAMLADADEGVLLIAGTALYRIDPRAVPAAAPAL